jgi:hypothetical protein
MNCPIANDEREGEKRTPKTKAIELCKSHLRGACHHLFPIVLIIETDPGTVGGNCVITHEYSRGQGHWGPA